MPIPVKFERLLNQDGTLKIDDYCEILNLRVPFTDLDVKSAYKPLALEYHPDKNRDCPYAITVFQAIADAKDKLLDPSTCQLYLRSLRELGVGRAGAGASADRASATYAPRSAAAAPPASAAPAQSARSTKPSRFSSADPTSSPPPAPPGSSPPCPACQTRTRRGPCTRRRGWRWRCTLAVLCSRTASWMRCCGGAGGRSRGHAGQRICFPTYG